MTINLLLFGGTTRKSNYANTKARHWKWY